MNRTLNSYLGVCGARKRVLKSAGYTKSTRNEKHGYVEKVGTKIKHYWYSKFFEFNSDNDIMTI